MYISLVWVLRSQNVHKNVVTDEVGITYSSEAFLFLINHRLCKWELQNLRHEEAGAELPSTRFVLQAPNLLQNIELALVNSPESVLGGAMSILFIV